MIFATTIIFYVVGGVPSMTLEHVDCTEDYIHGYLNVFNLYFKANEQVKNLCLIIAGLMCDAVVAIMLYQWVFFAKTWRMPIALFGLYSMRLICSVSNQIVFNFLFECQVTFRMRYPTDFIWGYPGFPSFTTPYGLANDFHFAVHVSLSILAANELWTVKYYNWSYLALVTSVTQTFLALSTRGAYSIDIIAAFLFGHFFWLVGEKLCYYIDVSIFGNCFQERFPDFVKECGNCKTPINNWTNNTLEDLQPKNKQIKKKKN